jgi:hypothetical protein
MTVLALFDSHTLWEITLGIGAVVLVVVIALMALLLSLVIDIQRGAEGLMDGAGELAGNTKNLRNLASTGKVLDDILTEASIHATYFKSAGG